MRIKMEPWMTVILCVVSFIASGVIFGFIAFKKGHQKGEEDRKRFAEAEIGSAAARPQPELHKDLYAAR